MNSSASTSKRKPNKKKLMIAKCPSKNGGKRALLCKATTPTKLINIENDVPTRLSNKTLVELSQTHKKVKETCYFCQYSLHNNCSILQRNSRRNNIECHVGWLDQTPQLPDIDLINNFNYELLYQYANGTSDSEFSSGNEINSSFQKDEKENEIAKKQVKLIFLKENILSEIDKLNYLRNENNLDNVNIGDIQDKPHFNVEQEFDKELKTKETLEYFGLSHIEDMFTGSDNEEAAGYQSDSTIIYSPIDPTKKVKSFYVISDSESDLEVTTDTCNDGELLKKRHISESDSEGPVYKSKKSGHVDDLMKINIASSASSSTSASTHADNKNKARDIETREERDNKFVDKDTVCESDNFMVLISNIDSENNNMFKTLTREPNNGSDSKGTMFKSAYTPIVKNVFDSRSTKNSVDISRNESEIILESIIDISDNDRYLSNNTDMSTNGKLLKTRNIESVNEVQEIESANKEKTIASFPTNNTINLPFVDNENDVLFIETNLSCIVISDTDSDSDNNTDMKTNGKLLKERNNGSNNEFQDIESVNKGVNANITSFTSNKTINYPLNENDNDIQVIETNIPCTVLSDADSDSENNIELTVNYLREQNNEPNHEADDVSASNKVVATYAITDSDSDLEDGWLDQYLRYQSY